MIFLFEYYSNMDLGPPHHAHIKPCIGTVGDFLLLLDLLDIDIYSLENYEPHIKQSSSSSTFDGFLSGSIVNC